MPTPLVELHYDTYADNDQRKASLYQKTPQRPGEPNPQRSRQ